MTSLTIKLNIGDWLTPIKNIFYGTLSHITRENRDKFIDTFDRVCLRLVVLVILLATIFLIIMSLPHVINIILSGINYLLTIRPSRSVQGRLHYSPLMSLLPLLIVLMN